MEPGADFSSQSEKETLADVSWPEWRKPKDLRCTDLQQGEMSHKHGANEE